ncbi:MAG: hypothetical protein HYT06_00795, partial [Candidatus Levybacteria bacterium]|nr:hypothetical protein [Candidatus Levybacteria bacterium]
YEIYQRFFAPIEMSRAIFYGQKGDKTLEKFRALVAVSRRRIPLRRIERAETVAKTAVNKEAQRIVDQRRPSSEEIVVFG